MTDIEIPSLPANVGESIHFHGGSSKKPMTVTRINESDFEVRYDNQPEYLAVLEQDGTDSFYLTPAKGVIAVGGGWDTWSFFYEHF